MNSLIGRWRRPACRWRPAPLGVLPDLHFTAVAAHPALHPIARCGGQSAFLQCHFPAALRHPLLSQKPAAAPAVMLSSSTSSCPPARVCT